MVTILDLKKAKMNAMKEHNKNAQIALDVVICAYQKNEIEKKAKGVSMNDADMVSILNHAIKELSDEKEMYLSGNRAEDASNTQIQIDTIKGYLPKMMSEEEIRNVIASLEDKSIKSIMVEFKTKYAGKADMGLVNKIAREYQ